MALRRDLPLTEADWLSGPHPDAMLYHLGDRVSVRQLRLIGVACCRRLSRWVRAEASLPVLDVAERYADGLASEEERQTAHRAVREASWPNRAAGGDRWREQVGVFVRWVLLGVLESDRYVQINRVDHRNAARAAYAAGHRGRTAGKNAAALAGEAAQVAEVAAQVQTIRDVVGNPFRSATIDPAWLAWSGGLVVKLALGAYEERDFACLPVLADALEDAGCIDEVILSHLRSPGPHVRGCWAVDLILGKG